MFWPKLYFGKNNLLALTNKINVLPKLYFGPNYNLVGTKFWSNPYSGQDNNLDQTVFGQNYILAFTIFDQNFILAGTRIWLFWPINVLAQTMFWPPKLCFGHYNILAFTIFDQNYILAGTRFWPINVLAQTVFWPPNIFSVAHR